MGRLEGKVALVTGAGSAPPEDVANAVLFLASEEAAFVNGATLMVDGGATVYLPSVQFAGGE